MMRAVLAMASALFLLSCIAGGADTADEAALANARPVGAPVDCLTLSRIGTTRVRDDRTIDFHLRDGRVFRNRLAYRCPGLGFEESFSYSTSLPRLCSVDLVRVRTSTGLQGAGCGLGKFQQIETGTR